MTNTYLFSNSAFTDEPIIFAYEGTSLVEAHRALKSACGADVERNTDIKCEVIENNSLGCLL